MMKLRNLLFALAILPGLVFAQTTLRQSDAIELSFGPFVDSTDGATAETALTISQADVRLKKCTAAATCAAWAQKNDATSCTHEENGWYECPLNATDTDTVGILYVAIHESGALAVWQEFTIVEESIYDASLAASAAASVAQTGDSFARLAAPAGASVSADIAAIKTVVDSVSTDTGTTIPGDIASVQSDTDDLQTQIGTAGAGLTAADDAVMTRLGAPAGASVSADIAALPTAAENATEHLTQQRILTGTCDSGSTTTCVDADLTQADETQLDDRLICFDDSWCALITGFTPASDEVTTTKTAPSTRASKAYTIFPATAQ